jgi:hypothetical protein
MDDNGRQCILLNGCGDNNDKHNNNNNDNGLDNDGTGGVRKTN